ncbi:MAG: Jag N-terminal domain-containing protein [Acidimicrobiia bacterium]|nr:Jag N-terminal domain-containing protein [Acidimicrobiia bacterium]
MEWIEVTGKTLDEARERALDELGVHLTELEYEVLDEPKGGLFGRFGRVEARIRARVKPVSRDKPNDRRRRRGGSESRGPKGGRESSGGRTRRPGGQGGGHETERPPAEKAARESAGTGSSPGGASGVPRKRRRSRSRRPSGAAEQGRETAERSDKIDEPSGGRRRDEGVSVNEITMPIEEQAEAAEAFTAGLVEAFGLGASASAVVVEDAVEVDVEGEDLGLLVGPKGATLAAIEELVRAAMSRTTGGKSARVHVDVAGYRRRRREALAEFVRGIAADVVETGEEKAMEPMPPADRKVIHDTVAEMDGVTTASEGEDARRHVVIRPA